MKSLIASLSSYILFLSVSYSQEINVRKLDSLFDMLQTRGLASGSVAITIDGRTGYQRAIGFTAYDNDIMTRPDVNTKYRIGSVSKMFTAVIVFQLIDEKKLTLDDKLANFFPQLPNSSKISIRQLLHHRSGLHDYTVNTNFPEWMDKSRSRTEMLSMIESKGVDFEPGTQALYCNTNYLLLSYIVEIVSGTPYSEALTKRITSPLRLTNTFYGKQIDIRRNEARSYKHSESSWNAEKETDASIHYGAGSLVSTPGDLTVFIQRLFGGDLISKTSLKQMTTIIDGYGMGIFPFDYKKTKGYGHKGRIEEFYSSVRYFPEKKLAISYVTNGILYPRADITDAILKICFDENYILPFSRIVTSKSSDLVRYAGTYSSGALPFKVICKPGADGLTFEAAGKTMHAEPVNINYFMNLKSGSFFEFFPHKGELHVKETDNVYILKKENETAH